MYRQPFTPDPRLSQPNYQASGYVPFPPKQGPASIEDVAATHKRQRVDEIEAAFSYGDRSVQQPRQGQEPHFINLRWADSDGNGTVKNYQTFGWNINPALEGYSRMYIDSVIFTQLYAQTEITAVGMQIDPLVSPTQLSDDDTAVKPVFMIPNQVISSQGQVLPSAANQNYFSYQRASDNGPYSINVKGQTLSRLTLHLCDDAYTTLTNGVMTNYKFSLNLCFV